MIQGGKTIIHIDEGIDTTTALQLVQSVVSNGKVSNSNYKTQYCYHTDFTVFTDNYPENYHVTADINDKSHVFKVWKE